MHHFERECPILAFFLQGWAGMVRALGGWFFNGVIDKLKTMH
jgi:hypothetical protein